MRLYIYEDARAASQHIADLLISRISKFVPSANRPYYVLGLPTGSSPERVYALLAAAHKAGKVSFKDVVTFNMDEYVGLPTSHSQSYHTFMYKHLFSQIDISPKNVHILDGNAPDLSRECEEYEAAISRHGPIDLFLGGVGSSGHIAFNEPFSSLSSRTRIVDLAHSTIAANSRFFAGVSRSDSDSGDGGSPIDAQARVPIRALSVGVRTILDAREVVILATGEGKADAVRAGVEGPIGARWPISALQLHPNWMMVVDEGAAGALQKDTVEYFKRVQQHSEAERPMNVANSSKL